MEWTEHGRGTEGRSPTMRSKESPFPTLRPNLPVQAMPLLAWPGAWWRRDARTSCSAVALPVAKRRRISKTKPKQTAPTRSREAEGAQATAGTAAAPVEAARFETGDLVIIDGLTSRPELNGCNARVRGSDPAKGRLVLDLLHSGVGGTQISVKCVNCRKANVEEANEVVANLEHELAEAQARSLKALSAEREELRTCKERLQACLAAAQAQQASGEEEIEEICTPSVAADLRRERRVRERREWGREQGCLGCEGEGCAACEGESEEEEGEEAEGYSESDSDDSSGTDNLSDGAFPFF